MARIKIRYLVSKPGRRQPDGSREMRWIWQPSLALRAQGWTPRRLRDDNGYPIIDPLAAAAAAEALNAQLDGARTGALAGPEPTAKGRVRGTMGWAIQEYCQSERYRRLAERTRIGYDFCLRGLEDWTGDAPVASITPQLVQRYYRRLQADRTLSAANARLRVLRLLMEFCRRDLGLITRNPASRPGMIGTAPRLRIWTEAEITAIVAAADAAGLPSIGDAVLLGLYTGQRQGDVLRLSWLTMKAGATPRLRLQQSKRRAHVDIPLHPRLAARLEATRARRHNQGPVIGPILVSESTGRAYKPDHFRHAFTDLRVKAAEACPSITTATYQDLRDTAVTALATAGCTIPEICAITGHSEGSAHGILKHYLALTGELADSAIAKLVAYDEQQEKEGTA